MPIAVGAQGRCAQVRPTPPRTTARRSAFSGSNRPIAAAAAGKTPSPGNAQPTRSVQAQQMTDRLNTARQSPRVRGCSEHQCRYTHCPQGIYRFAVQAGERTPCRHAHPCNHTRAQGAAGASTAVACPSADAQTPPPYHRTLPTAVSALSTQRACTSTSNTSTENGARQYRRAGPESADTK